MKISPVPQVSIPTIDPQTGQVPSRVDSIRTLRMTTNRTPLTSAPPLGEELPNSDNSRQEGTVEATQPLSPQLALLAKQRRALQVRERELRDREKALMSKNQEGSSIEMARLKSEPLRVLLENGVTYDQLTEALMSGQGGNPEVYALQSKIDSLEKTLEQRFSDHAANEERQVLSEIQADAKHLLNTDDRFQTFRAIGKLSDVPRLAKALYQAEGRIYSADECLQMLEDQAFEEAKKLASLDKLRSQFMPATPPPASSMRPQGMRTLTNRDTAQPPMTRHQRALAAFWNRK